MLKTVPAPTDEHVMYKRPPVAIVVAETKFPGTIGAPVPPTVQRALAEVLGIDWVVDQVQPGLALSMGMSAPMLVGETAGRPSQAIVRFSNRERTTAIALTAGSVTVETTLYGNWLQFRSVLEQALRAADKLLRPVGMTRAGLRYVDEIRVPGIASAEWSDWLGPEALAPASAMMAQLGWPPVNWNGAAQYQLGPDRQMVLRYGAQPAQPGYAVNPVGPLRRISPPPPGPFFLLDFDAYWEPSTIPTWSTSDLLETYDQLREPVRRLFDNVISDRLVEGVFNKEEA